MLPSSLQVRLFPVFAAASLGAAALLRAQEPSASLKQADAAYKAGQAAMARHDLNAARQEFERVVRLAPQAEQGHSALGAVEVALGQTAAGIRELEKALTLDPKDSSAQLNLALAYEQTGSAAKALPLFAKLDGAAKAAPLPPYALAAYARALAGTQPSAALAKMQAAVAADPGNAVLHDELGSLYAQEKDWPNAEGQFGEAVRLDAGLPAAHLHLGLALEAQSKPGTLEQLAKASQLAPTDLAIGLERGNALSAAEKDEDAIAVYQRLHEAHPESTAVDYPLALALQRAGHTEAAIPLFEKTVAAEPANAEALANLGLALTQMQRAKDAIAPLKDSLRLAPGNVVAKQDLAAAYIQLNQLDEAVAQLKEAMVLAPDSAEIHYNLGLAYKMEDNAVAAIPELEKAETLNANASEAPYVLGVLYMQAGRYDDAARELDRSLKLQPQNGDGWSTLGSVYAKMDKLPEAVSALHEAIRQIPGQPDPHLTLAGVLAKQGDAAGAAAERKQAAALMKTNMNRERAEVATHAANGLLHDGKVEDAIGQFKEALSYDPDYVDAHRGLASALQQQGDSAAATSERQKAEALESAAKKP